MIIREVKDKTLAAFVRDHVANGYTALSDVVARTLDISAGKLFLESRKLITNEDIGSDTATKANSELWDRGLSRLGMRPTDTWRYTKMGTSMTREEMRCLEGTRAT